LGLFSDSPFELLQLAVTYTLHRELLVPRPLSEVFEFFSRAENLQRVTPPWLHFTMRTPTPIQMGPGAVIEYSIRVRGIPLRWRTLIESLNPPHQFVDVQAKGPYKLWRHTHTFAQVPGGTMISDHVEYELPFGIIGRLVNRLQVSRDLAKVFDYRSDQVLRIFR
jgi:ligand-binding SRPBCC domain-containing protein